MFLAAKPRNVRFSRRGIGLSRFRSGNLRWAKARCLGRHETRLVKTSCSLGMYRYETRQAERSTAMTHFNQLRILGIRGFYVLLAKKVVFQVRYVADTAVHAGQAKRSPAISHLIKSPIFSFCRSRWQIVLSIAGI